jgi:hypothetical protein
LRRAILIILAMSVSPTAHASGDPGVIYWIGAGGLLGLAVAGVFAFSESFKSIRLIVLAPYLLAVGAVWLWAMNVDGPDFTLAYAAILGTPVLALLLGVLSARYFNSRRRQQN